jgi:Beta-propeller repeat
LISDRAFVAKLDLTQSGSRSLLYSTYLGGSGGDEGRGIAVDANGNAYVGGITRALGMWPMISNNELALVYGPDVTVADSEFPDPQGTWALTNAPKKPTIANFIPVSSSELGVSPQGALNDILANTNNMADSEPFLAPKSTTANFKTELARPISAVGFVGHSLDLQVTPPPNSPVFSIGMVFSDTNLVRKPESGDNPDYSSSVSASDDLEVQLSTNASVVFIGSCYVGSYFESLWAIDITTTGKALIVPSNPSQQSVLGHSVFAWSNILHDMLVNGMTVDDAVRQTNGYLHSLKDVNGHAVIEQWQVIGDKSVKIQ